ncbi:MAG TPA: polysaccharide deacetylase family protein [Longimicrobiales bacterium]
MMAAIKDALVMARTYVQGGYPPYVRSGAIREDDLIAFVYHDVQADALEPHLRYLRENGYETITCDEAVERRRARGHDRTVLLTFDDGLASLYEQVYPILRAYRMRAVAYIAPAWIGRPGFLTWEQCREMHRSGLFDFQSHSNAHDRVVTRPTVEGIWIRRRPGHVPWGLPGITPEMLDRGVRWLPVLPGASRFEDAPRVRLPDTFWEECLHAQPAAGRDARALRRLAQELLRRHARPGAYEVERHTLERMVESLEASRQAIERELAGHRVRHFAFPWMKSSATAWTALERCGFASGAIGLFTPDEPGATAAPGLLRIHRVNGDYCLALPGRGRQSFFRVTAAKARRRIAGANPYGL